jgi:hypothetical protein
VYNVRRLRKLNPQKAASAQENVVFSSDGRVVQANSGRREQGYWRSDDKRLEDEYCDSEDNHIAAWGSSLGPSILRYILPKAESSSFPNSWAEEEEEPHAPTYALSENTCGARRKRRGWRMEPKALSIRVFCLDGSKLYSLGHYFSPARIEEQRLDSGEGAFIKNWQLSTINPSG